jgi:hypothetical protein
LKEPFVVKSRGWSSKEYCDDSSQILKDILENDQSSESEESESDEEIDG